MTYAEKIEYDSLAEEIDSLESNKKALIDEMQKVSGSDYQKLGDLQKKVDDLDEDILEKLDRWEKLDTYVN